uniref:F-box/FBD/LRR-repeat protein At1g13570-like isoform X1 n=1 Tax=Erigeron canadensis TaxID=72917 RepID=UPI001CB8AEBB|nr:F-box/FBD/LRR-repeat protein At1g13570-like isoform X1 [Erigeron canadensis]XP_043619087.1 F-box/FBD/LRR-repeat protein At1g13570-like isoform X1 [Erigeron canadensis]
MNWRATPVKLPTHLFSCLELKQLCLHNCVLPPLPYFRGFPKLLSLTLINVRFQDHKCGELIAQSPLLETLEILNSELKRDVKLVEIAKLENVKMLSLSLCLLDKMTIPSVFQHVSLLPKLQELYLSFRNSKFLPNDVAKNPVFTTYPFLKALDLMKLYIGNNSMSSRDFGVLFDRVNLQTFKIKAIYKEAGREPDTVVDCDLIEEMELQSKLLTNIKGNIENEECFVKSILERSPFLNTITMDPHSFRFFNAGDVKIWFANKLFRFPRASPAAVIALRPLK